MNASSSVQTIQLTGKKFKLQQILAVVLILASLAVWVFGNAPAAGPMLMIAGILWFFTVKILIWWNHA
jgi:hypothetical protein